MQRPLANFNLAALVPGCADTLENFYRKYLVAVATPPAIVVMCALVHCVAECARVRCYRSSSGSNQPQTDADGYEDVKRRCWRNAAWLLTMSYSGVTKTIMHVYNARRLDVGSFLRYDYAVRVGDARHGRYATFGFFALAAYPVGIPLVFAYVLWRGNLEDRAFQAKFGFLYKMYKPSFVAWELTGILTKLTLAAIPVFATERRLRGREIDETAFDYGSGIGFATACQATISQTALIAYLIAILWFRPHKAPAHISQQATAVAVVMGWVLVIGNVMNTETDDDDDEFANEAAAFTAEERVYVGLAVAVATAVAAAVILYWSFVAGDFDNILHASRRACRDMRNVYRRVSSNKTTPRSPDATNDDDELDGDDSVVHVEVMIPDDRDAFRKEDDVEDTELH
jgi:hypothetical protein